MGPSLASMFGALTIDLSTSLLRLSLFSLFSTTLLTLGVAVYASALSKKITVTTAYFYSVSNYFLTLILVSHGALFTANFYLYLKTVEELAFLTTSDPLIAFKNCASCTFMGSVLSIDLYGFVLLLLAFFVGFFALITSESKIKDLNTSFFFFFNYFLLIVFVFVATTDLFILFICYELLLIPSFFFVFFIGYTRKAIQASLYFVIWTQVGSLLVLAGIVYLVSVVGTSSIFAVRTQLFKSQEAYALYFLFFFGFGFKIPIWPFHYWLTKTHVESPSGFSIYLSGFLVKSALYAFFKITNLISCDIETVLFSTIAFIGSVDASLKMWGQSDLKKLVAYCTIQEMNLILLMFLTGDSSAAVCGILFSAAHAFLSSLMFFLVDCIYRRFHTRSVYGLHGLMQRAPTLGIFIIGMCVLYAGLPGTIKFSCEFYIFATLLESSWLSCILLVFILNVFGLVGFSKPWFNVVFGLPNSHMPENVLDLSRREVYIILYTFSFFFFITYLSLLAL